MKKLLTLLLCSAALLCRAQNGEPLTIVAGPAGNYIYINTPEDGRPLDTARLAATRYYLIERAPADSSSGTAAGGFREIGKAQPVQNARALHAYYTDEDIAEMQRSFNLAGEADVLNFFQKRRNPEAFGLYYLLLPTKLATGNVYLDMDVRRGVTYRYRATRVGNDDTKEVVATGTVITGAPNPVLALLRPRARRISSGDTAFTLSWAMPADSLLNARPSGIPAKQLLMTINGLKARIMLSDASNTGYREAARLIPTGNDSERTTNIIHHQSAKPEQQYNAYAILEDEVGNAGPYSDTLTAFTVSPANMPVLRNMNATAVPDGVRLGWPRVVSKPYIVGVRLTKYDEQDRLQELAIVPLTDTSFVDYATKPGTSYRYFGEILFAAGLNLKQVAPVQVTGAANIFSDPLPPFNLRASNTGRDILLEWDAQNQASIYAYYVYRGTSPNNLSLIAGPLQGNWRFTDTAHHLSGRSQYFYAVQAENYRQVMSPFSEQAAITPERKIETVSPRTLQFYYTGKSLHIRFPDVREDDNAIVGYVVRGREKGANGFRYHSGLLNQANAEDSSGFSAGQTYQYQVAAVSMRGDTSSYSEFSEFFLPKEPVTQAGIFYLRNITGGVAISWPSVIYPNRKAYNIYRRGADEEGYVKIASTPATQFSYTDADAKAGEVYVYAISVTESDDREGERGEAKSIRREAVKATTISE